MAARMMQEVESALEVLKRGGTICYPTDTIWGLGCDATSPEAVERIYEIKKRPGSKSLIVFATSWEAAGNFVTELPLEKILELTAGDRPTTLVLEGANGLATNLLAEDGSVAIRIPDDAFCQALLKSFGKPLVSTSANLSGRPFDGQFSSIHPEIINGVDFVVNWKRGQINAGKPSRILRLFPDGSTHIIRD